VGEQRVALFAEQRDFRAGFGAAGNVAAQRGEFAGADAADEFRADGELRPEGFLEDR
jgi:hypothetical protein